MIRAKQRVAHITSAHPAWDTRIVRREVATLERHGYQVVLVVNRSRTASAPPGLQLLPVGLPSKSLPRILLASLVLLLPAMRLRASIYHLHDPELFPLALMLKALRCRVIIDVHEDLPAQIRSKHWIPGFLRRAVSLLAGLIEQVTARLVDGTVLARPALCSRFTGAARVVTVENFPVVSELAPSRSRQLSEQPSFLYVGTVARIRGAGQMIEALRILNENLGIDATLTLAGPCYPKSLRGVLEGMRGWHYVRYAEWVDRHQFRSMSQSAWAGLALLQPVPNYLEDRPTKLFEYMASAMAVVGSDMPMYREVIERHRCGVVVDSTSARDIAGALRDIASSREAAMEMGLRGAAAARDSYSWQTEGEKLLDLYGDILQ